MNLIRIILFSTFFSFVQGQLIEIVSNEAEDFFVIEGDTILQSKIELKEVIVFQPLKFFSFEEAKSYVILRNRIYKVYPHLQSADEGDGQKDGGPPVQRVSSASVGSRQQTRGKVKNGVTFSKSEVERLRGLKPHNMSEQDWLKRVAQEKQKIAQREAV